MEMPPEISVPLCIEQGSIYHFLLEALNHDGTNYRGNRFFLVLNVNPKTDELLVLTTITSKIQRAEEFVQKIGEDPQTIVKISTSDFSRLSRDSIVNCNNVYSMTKDDLVIRLEGDGAVVFFEKLPKSTIESLVSGVLKSNQVSNEHKKLLI